MKTLNQNRVISSVIVIAVFCMMFFQSAFSRQIDLGPKAALKSYIEKAGKEPVQYMIEKFQSKKIVILTESGKYKHEIEFVKALLSKMYNSGIYNLAAEFGNTEDQKIVDDLLTADNFNREKAMQLMRNYKQDGAFGYKEYLDIYKTAWDLNQNRTPNAPKFRIVFLNSGKYQNAKYCASTKNKEMADIIQKEILQKGEKALVFSFANGAENNQEIMKTTSDLAEVRKSRLSGILNAKFNGSTASIRFHAPWTTIDKGNNKVNGLMKPLDGEIDEVLETLGNLPVGFDIEGSPIQNSGDKKSSFYEANKDYTLGCLCDGYIYLKQYSDYEFAEWIPDFINEEYFEYVKSVFNKMNPDLKIETLDYANDLCSALDWSILESAKLLQGKDYVRLDSPVPQASR